MLAIYLRKFLTTVYTQDIFILNEFVMFMHKYKYLQKN